MFARATATTAILFYTAAFSRAPCIAPLPPPALKGESILPISTELVYRPLSQSSPASQARHVQASGTLRVVRARSDPRQSGWNLARGGDHATKAAGLLRLRLLLDLVELGVRSKREGVNSILHVFAVGEILCGKNGDGVKIDPGLSWYALR